MKVKSLLRGQSKALGQARELAVRYAKEKADNPPALNDLQLGKAITIYDLATEVVKRRLPTCQHLPSRRGRRRCPEDGSPIRKIRASRGLDAIPASLPLEGVPAGSLARG